MRFVLTLIVLLLFASPSFSQERPKKNGADEAQKTLFRAIQFGDIALAREAIDQGADVNETEHGLTPWWHARVAGLQEIADLLEESGADTSVAEPPVAASLESFLSHRIGKESPGYAVMASRDGKIILDVCVGKANVKDSKPITADKRFLIGSVTKQFTAAAILKLQEDGKLSVNDKLSKYIPDFESGDKITLDHLLTHTSGITNYTNGAAFALTCRFETNEEDLIASFKSAELEFAPGDRYAYCNSGYFLLGHIVGKVSGKPLKEYLQDTFFEPLNMKDTGLHDGQWDFPNHATGYNVKDGEIDPTKGWHLTRAGGAGAMYSTTKDMIKWNDALFAGKVISKESLTAATKPTILNDGTRSDYGYGLQVGTHRGLPTVAHSGGLDGFVSYLIRYPKQKMTVVALLNAMPSQGMPSHIKTARNVAEHLLWREMKPRPIRIEKKLDVETLKDFVGAYDYGSPITMEVTLEDGKLFAQLTSQNKYQIYARGDDTFFWKVVDAEVVFLRDDDGKVVAALHRQGGSENRHKRLKTKPVFPLTEEQLDAFVGSYDYKTGIARFTRDGKQLYAQLAGQPRFKVYAIAENEFEWRVVNASVKFFKDRDGKVTKGRHTQLGIGFDVTRIEQAKLIELKPAELSQYAGRYDYGLLAGKMQVKVKDGRLIAKLPGQGWLEIQPIAKDEFQWKDVNAKIKFVRDKDGKITGGEHDQGGRVLKVPRVESE